jgi:hypothetical protein
MINLETDSASYVGHQNPERTSSPWLEHYEWTNLIYCKTLASVSSGDKHAPVMQADKSCVCIPHIFKYEILLELLGSTCGYKEVRTPVLCRDSRLQIRPLGCILGRRGLHKIEPCVLEVEVGENHIMRNSTVGMLWQNITELIKSRRLA